jgi:hypothetical protein
MNVKERENILSKKQMVPKSKVNMNVLNLSEKMKIFWFVVFSIMGKMNQASIVFEIMSMK